MTQSFIERLREQAAGLAPRAAPVKRQERRLVQVGAWDKRKWSDEARDLKPVDNLIYDLTMGDKHRDGERQSFDSAPELIEGLFHLFHKALPNLTPKRALERELVPAHKILEEVAKHPRLAELQDYTISDVPMSAMAIATMGEVINEMLVRVSRPEPPKLPGDGQGGGQPDGQNDGQDQEGPGQDGRPEGDGGDSDTDSAEADWEAAYDEALSGLDLDRLVDDAIEAAAHDAGELDALRKSVGCEDGEWKTMDPSERMAMAEQLRTPETRALAWAVGQMKRFALGLKATKVNDIPHAMYDVELGNNLKLILPSQYALLGNPATKYEFYRRYAMKKLLIKKKRGTSEVAKGPVVVCIDKSSSMNIPNGGPIRWAMAVAEALRQFCQEDDRDYYVLFFGTNNDRTRFNFPGGKAPIKQVLAFLGTVAKGGTDFDGVLDEALEYASQTYDEDGKGRSEIVFITDGEAELSDQWIREFNTERERVGVRVFSVYIGGAPDTSATGPVGLLKKISDVTIPVRELRPQSVQAVFSRV